MLTENIYYGSAGFSLGLTVWGQGLLPTNSHEHRGGLLVTRPVSPFAVLQGGQEMPLYLEINKVNF